MVIRAYQTQPYETTHERRIFDAFLCELNKAWGDSQEDVFVFSNFYCGSAEIDAAVLKKDSITIIDFKNYGGKILINNNNKWLADNVEIKGGSKPNPFIQIRDNKRALIDTLDNIVFPNGFQPSFHHISGLVLFHKPIMFDERQLMPKIATWFHVVDFDRVIERLSQITSREIRLSNQNLLKIAQALSIPKYKPIGSSIEVATSSLKRFEAELKLPSSLYPAISQVETFLDSSEKIMVITGMIGTGIQQLLDAISSMALKNGRNFTILAPNRRISSLYKNKANSIYNHIYSLDSRIEEEKFICDLKENNDVENHIYIVGDAHSISNKIFEKNNIQYGSGKLLTDFFDFANLDNSARKIIFLGDPFQSIIGKIDESALCKERLQAIVGFKVNEVILDRILPNREHDLFIVNCSSLAKGIEEGRFNRLHIITDKERVIEAPSEKNAKHQLLKNLFIKDPKFTKFISFTHEEVNKINNWVRQKVFGCKNFLVAGDIVHIHNSFFVYDNDDLGLPIYVSNNSFAEVITVDKNVESIVQLIERQEKPVAVHFLRIRVRLLDDLREVEFLCLKNYLYADKPEVDVDILQALYVATKAEFDREWEKINYNNIEESDRLYKSELTKFLRNNPYYNAARLRFGYALTIDRAKGQMFKTVVANMNNDRGQTNEDYFRKIYTLFSVVREKIVLSEIPSISLLYRAKWEIERGKMDSVNPKNSIAFDPEDEAGNADIPNLPIATKPLRNLYLKITSILNPEGISIHFYKHHNYQEVYCFKDKTNELSCSLRLHYNSKYLVTRIEPTTSESNEFADRIISLITSKSDIILENAFQQNIFDIVKEKFDLQEISIQNIEHHSYQEIYYLKLSDGAVKLQLYYDGDDFITTIVPAVYTSLEVANKVRLALGV